MPGQPVAAAVALFIPYISRAIMLCCADQQQDSNYSKLTHESGVPIAAAAAAAAAAVLSSILPAPNICLYDTSIN
jgi:hypothetical protein